MSSLWSRLRAVLTQWHELPLLLLLLSGLLSSLLSLLV
jgi:hypothetical protein